MECKRCGSYSYIRKSSLCSKCKYDLKIEKAVENARMRAKNLHIHAVIPALQHSDAMCFNECPNCKDCESESEEVDLQTAFDRSNGNIENMKIKLINVTRTIDVDGNINYRK